jgi:integrase
MKNPPHNLQDILDDLIADGGSGNRKRNDQIYAIKTLARWCDETPSAIPCELPAIRSRFRRLSAGGLRVSGKRISNVKSSLLDALRLTGRATPSHRAAQLTAEWSRLRDALGNTDRYALSPLLRWASDSKIRLPEFDDAASAALLRHLETSTMLLDPRIRHQDFCRRWNRLCQSRPQLGCKPLVVPRYCQRLSLPWADLPKALVDEFETFLHRQAASDCFDVTAPMRSLRSSTITAYRQRFLVYVSALNKSGTPLQHITSLEFCLARASMEASLKYIMGWRNDPQRPSRYQTLDCIALLRTLQKRTDVESSEADINFLTSVSAKIRYETSGFSRRSRVRMRQLKSEVNLARLFIMPLTIAKRLASRKQSPTRKDALLFQRCLAMSILIFCPLRLKNLTGLRLDKHLVWQASGMRGDLHLELDASEMKNHQDAEMPLPQVCADLIRVYVQRFRPLLQPGQSPFLFCGRFSDRPKKQGMLGEQMQTLIRDQLGFTVNAHLFRHLVHLVVLRRIPGAYAMVARVLSHSSINTTLRNYSHIDVELSTRAYQDIVLEKIGYAGASEHQLQKLASAAELGGMYDAE